MDQHAQQNFNIDYKSFEKVAYFKYMGTTLTDQNSIHEETKSKLKPRNVYYHSVQNHLSSSLLSKNTVKRIWMLVIRIANYPDRLGPWCKFVKNSTQLVNLSRILHS